MQSDATRAAFTLSLLHQRRDDRRVISLAVLQSGRRVFLGLDNGVVEEHTCLAATAAGALHPSVAAAAGGMLVLRLLAEKKVFSKQGVADICPADAAARLVCLSEEGQVALVSLETFAVSPLPAARGAVAVAVQPAQHLPVLLAVAVKQGKGRSKVLLFSVLPGANVTGSHQPAVLLAQVQVPEAVLGLAWAGRSLLLAVPGGYQALHPVQQPPHSQATAAGGHTQPVTWQLAVLADHLADISPMLGCIPDLGLGLMLWEGNMVLVTDATGAAVREPLQLPMPPLALAAAGMFVVVLCDDGLHVFDRTSSREVQHIDYAHDDAHVRLRGRLPAASDSSCCCICLASSSQVLRLEPIALEQQVRELLKRKRFDQALDLIQSTPAAAQQQRQRQASPAQLQEQPSLDGATASPAAVAAAPAGLLPWQQIALAQAGLLLLLECEFEAGLSVLEGLPVEVWQPCQLFSLFPGTTARWLSKVPSRSYWGLHGSQLPDLQQLVTDMLELKAATAPTIQRQQQQQQQQQRHNWQQLQQQQAAAGADFFIGAEQQEAPWLTPSQFSHPPSIQSSSSSSVHHPHHRHVHGSSSSSSLSSTTFGINPAELQGLVQQGKTAIAGYLSRVRTRPGVYLLEGLDTLLLQLLCDVGDAAAIEALVTGQHAAAVGAAAGALRSAGRWHALAVLLMNAGQPQEALDTWQALASGDLQESPSSTGAIADEGGDAAAVAVAAAAAAMAAGTAMVPLQLLLEPSGEVGGSYCSNGSDRSGGRLRWLLSVDAAACLAVLEARSDLDPQQVLQLLEDAGDIDLCWQYLYHQVHHNSSSNSQLHTQLVTVLLAALSALIDSSSGGSNSSSSSSSSEPAVCSRVTAEQLADMVHQLPISFTPNATAAAAACGGEFHGLLRSHSQGLGLPPMQSGFGGSSSSSSYHRRQQSSPHHSRFPSLMGAGIPTASYFAISAADLARRGSRDLHHTQPQGAAIGGQISSHDLGRQQEQQQQQQQQQRRPFQPYHQLQQQQGQLGVLAGHPVSKPPHPHNLSGFGALSDAPGDAQGPRKTLSNIAQMLRLHAGPQASIIGSNNTDAIGQQTVHQQQQLQQHLSLNVEQQQQQQRQQALRVLPAGLGPWPVEPSGTCMDGIGQADATTAGNVTPDAAGGAGASDDDRQVRPAAVAAATAAAFDKVLLLRCLLVYHLQASLLYDVKAVLSAVGPLPLRPEQALLYSRAGRHSTALALLALCPPRLVEGAISYCRALGSQEAWLALLELFLNPAGFATGLQGLGEGLPQQSLQSLAVTEPDYASACRVLSAEGASLNPLRLLAALPSDMPLHLAGGLLGQVINGLQHRRRHGQVVRALHRCRNLAAHAELVELQAGRVLLTDDTPCNGCGRLIGAKVFYRYPSGVVVCGRCSGAVAAASGAEAAAMAVAAAGEVATGGIGGAGLGFGASAAEGY